MEKILYLAHVDQNGNLPKVALETLSGALQAVKDLAGSTLAVGLIGENVQAAADSLAGCGASKILGVSGADFGTARYATDVKAAEAIINAAAATIIIAPATSRFARALPGVIVAIGNAELGKEVYHGYVLTTVSKAVYPLGIIVRTNEADCLHKEQEFERARLLIFT